MWLCDRQSGAVNEALARRGPSSVGRAWQPTPMTRTLRACRASSVGSTDRFGDKQGLTPRAARISSAVRATNGLGVNLHGEAALPEWRSQRFMRAAEHAFGHGSKGRGVID